MKLSQIKGERCLDVIADLIDPVANLAQDKDVVEMLRPKKADGEDKYEAFTDRLRKGLPSILRTHKEDIIKILATIEGVSVPKYKKDLTLQKLFNDVFELLTDNEFASFFFSQATTPGASESASGATEVQAR